MYSAIYPSETLRRSSRKWMFLKGLCCFALITAAAQNAHAAFVGAYNFSNFTFVQSTFGDTSSWTSVGTDTLILTGPLDGSGLPGNADFVATAVTSGTISIDYSFATQDDPTWEYGGIHRHRLLLPGLYLVLRSACRYRRRIRIGNL